MFRNVLHVPKLGGNLLSVSQLTQTGSDVLFKSNGAIILHPTTNREMAKARCEGGLYQLRVAILNGERAHISIVTDSLDDGESDVYSYVAKSTPVSKASIETWHRRLGHLNTDAILQLESKKLVEGMEISPKTLPKSTCETCQRAKQTRTPILHETLTQADKVLGRVFSDLMEAKVKSKQGNMYWMTFVDDYSRYGTLAFLKNKDDALDAFKKFLVSAELEMGERMRILRSDGGGEYCSKEFEAFLAEKGIKHEKTNAYTPQENGVAERRNLTLANRTCALLDDNKLPTNLWQVAAKHAQHVTNIVPSRAIPQNTMLHEIWHKQKPVLTHLRVFGSKVWAHVPAKHRVKFDDRAIEGIYIGYVPNKRSYLILQ